MNFLLKIQKKPLHYFFSFLFFVIGKKMRIKPSLIHGAFSLILKDAQSNEITVQIVTTNECDSLW